MLVKLDHFPQVEVKTQNIFETTHHPVLLEIKIKFVSYLVVNMGYFRSQACTKFC